MDRLQDYIPCWNKQGKMFLHGLRVEVMAAFDSLPDKTSETQAVMANAVSGLDLEGGLGLAGNVEVNELTSLQRLNMRILRRTAEGSAFCSVSSGNSAESRSWTQERERQD